jgi:hypothetical protein
MGLGRLLVTGCVALLAQGFNYSAIPHWSSNTAMAGSHAAPDIQHVPSLPSRMMAGSTGSRSFTATYGAAIRLR